MCSDLVFLLLLSPPVGMLIQLVELLSIKFSELGHKNPQKTAIYQIHVTIKNITICYSNFADTFAIILLE